MKLKYTSIVFFVLTFINLYIFCNRNDFQYIPKSNLEKLYINCGKDCESKWKAFTQPYPKEELKEAAQISQEWIANKTTTLEKVIAIGGAIHQKFKQQYGTPRQDLLIQSPLQQYKILVSDSAKQLWCGIYAQMFSYFCWSQNIITRYIEIINPTDHHVVNECFIPELGKWIMIDATYNLLAVRDSARNLLDLQKFRKALEFYKPIYITQAPDTRQVSYLNYKEEFINTFYLAENRYNYHYYTSNAYAYQSTEKAKRYFLPVSWYEIYGSNIGSNFPYAIKVAMFLLWLATIAFLLVQFKIK